MTQDPPEEPKEDKLTILVDDEDDEPQYYVIKNLPGNLNNLVAMWRLDENCKLGCLDEWLEENEVDVQHVDGVPVTDCNSDLSE